MEGKGVEQDLILYVGQLELNNIPVKGWNIDPAVHGLHTDVMTRDIAMVNDGGRGLYVFLKPLTKGP